MKEETLLKALALRQELELLESVEKAIKPRFSEASGDEFRYRLTFAEFSCKNLEWYICDMATMKYIGDILDRHDKEIRKEIADRIAELKKEIEEL